MLNAIKQHHLSKEQWIALLGDFTLRDLHQFKNNHALAREAADHLLFSKHGADAFAYQENRLRKILFGERDYFNKIRHSEEARLQWLGYVERAMMNEEANYRSMTMLIIFKASLLNLPVNIDQIKVELSPEMFFKNDEKVLIQSELHFATNPSEYTRQIFEYINVTESNQNRASSISQCCRLYRRMDSSAKASFEMITLVHLKALLAFNNLVNECNLVTALCKAAILMLKIGSLDEKDKKEFIEVFEALMNRFDNIYEWKFVINCFKVALNEFKYGESNIVGLELNIEFQLFYFSHFIDQRQSILIVNNMLEKVYDDRFFSEDEKVLRALSVTLNQEGLMIVAKNLLDKKMNAMYYPDFIDKMDRNTLIRFTETVLSKPNRFEGALLLNIALYADETLFDYIVEYIEKAYPVLLMKVILERIFKANKDISDERFTFVLNRFINCRLYTPADRSKCASVLSTRLHVLDEDLQKEVIKAVKFRVRSQFVIAEYDCVESLQGSYYCIYPYLSDDEKSNICASLLNWFRDSHTHFPSVLRNIKQLPVNELDAFKDLDDHPCKALLDLEIDCIRAVKKPAHLQSRIN